LASSISVTTTAAPSAAKSLASAAPCPFAAPVISATLPSSLPLMPVPLSSCLRRALLMPVPARRRRALPRSRG